MLKVKITKVEEIDEENNKEKIFAVISVILNLPKLEAGSDVGLVLTDAPPVTISTSTISFADMKAIMDKYGFKKWADVRDYLEEKYIKYFKEVFKETL